MSDNVFPFRARGQGLRPIADVVVDAAGQLLANVEANRAEDLRSQWGMAESQAGEGSDPTGSDDEHPGLSRVLSRNRLPRTSPRLRASTDIDWD